MGSFSKSLQQEKIEQFPPVQDDILDYKAMPSWLDPRQELKEDAHLWQALLQMTENKELSSVLNGFRCGGTRIRAGKNGWVLRPDIDTTGRKAWSSQEEYNEFKERWLMPWIGTLGQLLKDLEKKVPFKKPS